MPVDHPGSSANPRIIRDTTYLLDDDASVAIANKDYMAISFLNQLSSEAFHETEKLLTSVVLRSLSRC